MGKTTYFYPNKTLRIGSTLLDLSTPKIMGILNLTPDSFYDGGKFKGVDAALAQAEKMISEGAHIIDVGGMSSRPGAQLIDPEEEILRVVPSISSIAKRFPSVAISVDTVHSKVAIAAIESGAGMINDISAGRFDPAILEVAARNKAAYVLMHMQGEPLNMQNNPEYTDVSSEIFEFLIQKSSECRQQGIVDIVIDPGFGFGKTLEQNYDLIRDFHRFTQIGHPVLAGISRKSLICKLLKTNPEKALNGSTALHTILCMKGAAILRVHDVREAVEVIQILNYLNTEHG